MFVPRKPFQTSLMFVGTAKTLLLCGAFERCFTRVGSGFTCKNLTRLQRLTNEKHKLIAVINKLLP